MAIANGGATSDTPKQLVKCIHHLSLSAMLEIKELLVTFFILCFVIFMAESIVTDRVAKRVTEWLIERIVIIF